MAGKEEQEPRLFKWGALIVGFVVVVLVLGTAIVHRILGGWPQSGTFGDTFGAANALFSGLAFGGVIVAILLQRKELELQRKELELTRKELARTAEAQEKSEQILRQQLYYSYLASKIDALNTAMAHYSKESKELSRVGKYPQSVVVDKKIVICKNEIEETLEIFRNANLNK